MNKIAVSFIATFAYNTAIAGLLTATGWMSQESNYGFWHNFMFSQSIGFSIAIISSLTLARMKPGRMRWAALGLVLPFSIAIGLTLGFELTGIGNWSHPYIWQSMLIALFFGLIASITFVLVERIGKLNEAIKERQLQVAEQDKRQLEAHLKLLQAQIEPHFLFNTLANVGSLINSDPALAKKLLERLDDWLRVALARARSDNTTLGDELEMLENYLQIMKIRFGERLRWKIDADDAARQALFPPMLLQPLVENAVRHGIEPKLGGGAILIRADIARGGLRIEVCDSGAGLPDGGNACGAGLANVRARLAALFGAAGKLILDNNTEGGATAVLEIPR
ncbi:MAG: histidine kinase [Gallionella sp.]|nr:histidine kinase [Gallionella sp.]